MSFSRLLGLGIIGAVGFVAYNQYKSQSESADGQLIGSPDGGGSNQYDFGNLFGDSPFNQGAGSSEVITGDAVNRNGQQFLSDEINQTKKEMSVAERSYLTSTPDVIQTGFRADGGVFKTGSGRNVAVEVVTPESRSQESSGVMIPDPITGQLRDSRQVFLTSYKPIGIQTTSSPSSQSSIDKPAGTLSQKPTNPNAPPKTKKEGKT